MKKTILVVLTLALVGIVVSAGCINTTAETDSPEGIWIMPGADHVLCMYPDGTYVLQGFENTAFGTYTVNGNKLSFGEPGVTLVDGPYREAEQMLFKLVGETDSFTIENSKLSLSSEGDETFFFVEGIAGNWVTEDGFTLYLNADKTFTVTGPVNTHFGTYAITLRGLEFTVEGSTKALGTEDEMWDERFFISFLEHAVTYTVDENANMVFYDAWGGEIFTFTASHEGTYASRSGELLVLNADGTFSGQAAVNTFKGTYEFADGKAVLKDFSMTKMAGSEAEMEAEAEFLENLAAAEYTLTFGGQFVNGYDKNGAPVLTFFYIAAEA